MHPSSRIEINNWLIGQGLAGISEGDILRGFCERCRNVGLPLSRGLMFVDSLHPVFEGRGFRWRDDENGQAVVFEYGRTNEGGEAEESWRRSPFYTLMVSGESEIRLRLDRDVPFDFSILNDIRADGHQEYVAFRHRVGNENALGDMDGVYSHWATREAGGFTDVQMETLRDLVPALALAIKSAALARLAHTLVHVYLGRDASQRVLGGRIARGMAEKITAVLWFSDLRGYTTISDAADPAEIIPLLNDYTGIAISAVQDAGGDVLKLMGDGVLAIFGSSDGADMTEARHDAVRAERALRDGIRDLNERRKAEGRPVTHAYVGLHVGEVLFGNIGSDNRLDFTVVGPAVNEVSRIASMCRSVDRDLLVSAAFRDGMDEAGKELFVSTGRFALRGVGRAQDLFTMDPAARLSEPSER